MNKFYTQLALVTFLFFAGLFGLIFLCCTMDTNRIKNSTSQPLKDVVESRFNVSKVGSFYDESAYHEKRCIYVIVDSKTGKEFVGISGVGISEMGNHASGKSHVEDER